MTATKENSVSVQGELIVKKGESLDVSALAITLKPRRRRGAIASYIDQTYPQGKPPGKTNKQIASEATKALGKEVSERGVRRAFGRK